MKLYLSTAKNQLVLFFLIAFILAWGTWIPAFLLPDFPKQLPLIGLFAPAISSLIVAWITKGKAGIAEILGRYKHWRFGLQWYGLSIVMVPAFFLLALLLSGIISAQPLQQFWLGSPLYFVLASFVWLMVINSGEEIGWRGFALPKLLEMVKSPILASIILGLIWGLWHLPIYLIPGQSSFPYPLFLLLTIGISFIYTKLFLETGGSLLAAVLLHASSDIGPRIFQIANFSTTIWLVIDLLILITAALLFYRPRLTGLPLASKD
ncbi:MAG: type II CAAX endopeptidase family protein [Anaerolineaceae bacterium]|nr:type II CAAX endopeptidase family protein [Anaerolineaceae bacterium]